RPSRWDIERECGGGADVRLAQAAEQYTQHGVGVGGGTYGRAGVGTHPLLIDDDRGRQPFEYINVGAGQRRHESLNECAVGLVDQPLRLSCNCAEHKRRLARSRDAGEDSQATFWDLDADVLQVVLTSALDADQIVAVGEVLAGEGHVRDTINQYRRFVK